MYTKLQKLITLSAISMMVTTTLYAGKVTIPHTFQANTPAKASEVNANFAEIKTKVNDNDNRISAIASTELDVSIELEEDYQDLTSITISTLTSGTIYLISSGTIQIAQKTNLAIASAGMGITNQSNSDPLVGNKVATYRSSSDGEGTYQVPYTVQGFFDVSAGTHTFYLVGNGKGGTSERVFNARLTAIFYGYQLAP